MSLATNQNDKPALMSEVTAFRRDLLRVLNEIGTSTGLEIQREVSAWYGEEVNHGRLYPNLDQLAEDGLLEKSIREPNNRSNSYEITDAGREFLGAL